jgi:uncharacterized membrane protein YGL010W
VTAGQKRRPSWAELMVLYRQAHRHPGTKLTHMFGIPMIVASLPVLLVRPAVGVGLFAGGWVLQFVGHYVFEKNDPQFFGDWRNLLVGVLWSGREWRHLIRGRRGRAADRR